jgi:two-component system NtrC family sensor kinase
MITDPEGTIQYVNPKFTEVTGYTPEEVIGQNPRILKSGQTPPEVFKEMWETITSGEEWRGELINKTKDGELYWDSMSISPIRNAEGVITHFLAVKENITERKRAEGALIQSEKMASLGRLTAGVSHEILNPLNIISMSHQLMLEDPATPPAVAQQLDILQGQVHRITKITQDLLSFSRQREPERSTVDVNEVVTRTLALMESELRLDNIEAELRLAEALPPILANQDQIQQVILNLLTNARDAMPGGGRLSLLTDMVLDDGQRFVELRVENTGPNIAPEHLDKLFDPFFTTKPEGEGTGLGLSICQGIIESHGGSIRAENVSGGGVAFTVRLS